MTIMNIEDLRDLYLANLHEIVPPWKKARAKHPGKYAKLPSLISLADGISTPLSLTDISSPRKVFCWSDTHFRHENIIKYSKRPFADIEEMDKQLIINYNNVVGNNDVCIWVGDVGWGIEHNINMTIDQCNGYKILIIGNHDFNRKKLHNLNFDEVHLIYTLDYVDISLVFTHFPMFNVPESMVNIHGHLHVSSPFDSGHPLHINVNCESQRYEPRLLLDILQQARTRLTSET